MAKKTVHETAALLLELHRIYLRASRVEPNPLTQAAIGTALGLKSGAIYVNRLFKKIERKEALPVFGGNNLAALREYVETLREPVPPTT